MIRPIILAVAAVATAAPADNDDPRGSLPQAYIGDGELADFALEVQRDQVILYLARKPTNEPLKGAKVVLQVSAEGRSEISLEETQLAGVYVAKVRGADVTPAQLVLEAGDETDIIDVVAATRGLGALPQPVAAANGRFDRTSVLYLAIGVMIGCVVGVAAILLLRRRRAPIGVLGLIALGFGVPGKLARAHEGHLHAPMPGEDASSVGEVHLAKKSQFLIELKTMPVTRQSLNEGFVNYGHVIAKPQLDAQIASPQAGVLRGTHSLTLGQAIQKGQTLALVETVGSVRIESPVAGQLLEIAAVEGARVASGQKLFRVTDLSTLWVDAELYERDLARLKEVSHASIAVDGAPEPLAAKILQAQTAINEASRTAKIFLELANPGGIRLGAFATIHFALRAATEEIAVPANAVLNRGGDQIVFVQTGPETFSQRTVATRPASAPGQVIVTLGLEAGERVVVSGNYQLLMKAK